MIELIWMEELNNYEYLSVLIEFLNLLLEKGNIDVQNSIYTFFVSNKDSERFFKKINDILLDEERR